jgi:uncharacterized protein with HEPN domain
MPKREMKLLLEDIIENAEMIFQFVGTDSYEEFVKDKMKIYAVVRAFEIIGEAAKIISPEIKLAYPLVEWQMMSDFRNMLAHHYFGIEYEILWKTIKESLPYNYELLKQVQL